MAAAGQIERVKVDIPYLPREAFRPLHDRTQRWAAIVAHRRAGKTVACINELIRAASLNTRKHPPPRYGYLAPTYAQAKDVAWSYLKYYASPFPNIDVREVDLQLTLPTGAIIRLYGADNYDRMRGVYFDGVIIDEPADIDPRAFPEVIRPALADHSGWAVFLGTPKGRNHFYQLVHRLDDEGNPIGDDDQWLILRLPASETGLLPESELADARRTMTEDQYQQEFECSFDAAIRGAFYAVELERAGQEHRLSSVAYDRYLPVMTAWDLGYTDSTSIWFIQAAGTEVHLIDYYQADSKPLAHYAAVLAEKKAAWGDGMRWGEHYFPHDVQAHELTVGRSRVATLRDLGIEAIVVPPHHVQDGINSTRRLFDRFWFDVGKCRLGIDALRQYRREFDDKTKMFKDKPLHDWASHGADALRTFAAGWYGNSQRPDNRVIDRHRKALYGRGEVKGSWKVA